MATFVGLINLTEQGMRSIKESPGRSESFRTMCKTAGAEVKGLYWTAGQFDGVVILEAPDDRTASALFLNLGRGGNVRTISMKAYDKSEVESVLQNVK